MFWSIFGQSLALILAIVFIGTVLAALISRGGSDDDTSQR